MFGLCPYFYIPTYSGHMKNGHFKGVISRKSLRKPSFFFHTDLSLWCREAQRTWDEVRRKDALEHTTGLVLKIEGESECLSSSQAGWCTQCYPVRTQKHLRRLTTLFGLNFVKLFQGLKQKLFCATLTSSCSFGLLLLRKLVSVALADGWWAMGCRKDHYHANLSGNLMILPFFIHSGKPLDTGHFGWSWKPTRKLEIGCCLPAAMLGGWRAVLLHGVAWG